MESIKQLNLYCSNERKSKRNKSMERFVTQSNVDGSLAEKNRNEN